MGRKLISKMDSELLLYNVYHSVFIGMVFWIFFNFCSSVISQNIASEFLKEITKGISILLFIIFLRGQNFMKISRDKSQLGGTAKIIWGLTVLFLYLIVGKFQVSFI